MKLHIDKEAFDDLSRLTSNYVNIPVNNIKRDYYICLMLQRLSKSKYMNHCVFKGGPH